MFFEIKHRRSDASTPLGADNHHTLAVRVLRASLLCVQHSRTQQGEGAAVRCFSAFYLWLWNEKQGPSLTFVRVEATVEMESLSTGPVPWAPDSASRGTLTGLLLTARGPRGLDSGWWWAHIVRSSWRPGPGKPSQTPPPPTPSPPPKPEQELNSPLYPALPPARESQTAGI